MSGALGQFLVDTLVYSGLLIVLVLALRAPVARWFGPQVAYALWALPLLRLFMPPLQLPASMAPAAPTAEPVLLAAQDLAPLPTYEAAPAAISLAEVLPALWLIGALLFLGWRIRQYFAMRRKFLADARPVGEAGKVRLVETPAAALPLAFGIGDKVVALPPGFMAHHDRAARDLAIAHELAHHRGHDLLANIAAQLLLALHWFNPVAWIGWRAMRKDQEAACDARVVEGRARAERVRYAEVIAGFAAGGRLSLPAPLACPMLGEKSIIHRLRTLTLAEVSAMRRRAGLAVVATGVLALPLTASISYAQPEVPVAPAQAPAPPQIERRIVIIDQPRSAETGNPALHTQEVRRADGTTVILRTDRQLTVEEARTRVEEAIATMPEPPPAPAPPAIGAPPAFAAPPAPPAPPAWSSSVRRMVVIDRAADGETSALLVDCDGVDDVHCRTQIREDALAQSHAARAAEHAQLAEAAALAAMQSAREAIARAPMPEEARAEALRELDREIARVRERGRLSWGSSQMPVVSAALRVNFGRVNPTTRKPAPAVRNSALLRQPTANCPEEPANSQIV